MKIPYIVHPVSVGMMLAHYGYSEDVVIAGILHDTVEDTGMTTTEIK
ncbi:MAG: HD domain-containing protein [Nitrospirae bacterium]|nr:HD domain-containing protein [Nitrospirota bacterium]